MRLILPAEAAASLYSAMTVLVVERHTEKIFAANFHSNLIGIYQVASVIVPGW